MQQQGGSQYGVPPPPDLTPFSSPGAAPRAHMLGISSPDPLQQQPQPQLAEAASPISSRPPPPGTAPRALSTNFEELVPAVPGNFPDDEALAAAGEDVERGTAPGNRWPRQETLALLKIRSDMDAAFREATLKGPLWEDVSRRLAELGYKRSGKKCKEKFENVHKYYKRTKEGRAGRQDGKSYRFFSQLEALHGSSSSSAAAPSPTTAPALPAAAAPANPTPTAPSGISTGMVGPSTGRIQPPPISTVAPPPITMPTRLGPELTPTTCTTQPGFSGSAAAAAGRISFSSNTSSSSSSSSESDDEETEEAGESREGRKRKRGGGSGRSRKIRAFFEGLMKQVMERQEAMQQRFLEAIEKREQDRMIREEAWRRQEMARLNREHELLAQERAMAASRDAAIISYIQKISGQTIQLPTMPAVPPVTLAPPQQPSVAPPPAPPPQQPQQPPSQQQQHQKSPTLMQPSQQQQELHQHHQSTEIGRHQVSSSSELVPVPEPQEPVGTVSFDTVSSSRWPKTEVHALIKLRSGLESRYQETGPKGPLWEEVSTEMQRLGYNRSAKRCKEKWENINKYFKKVKESNKKRPEDSKTCPYFHQLDALYRKKLGGGGGGGGSGFRILQQQEQESNPNSNPQERSDVPTIMAPPQAPPPPPPPQQPPAETESKKGNNNNNNNNRNGGNSEGGGGSRALQIQTSNGGLPPSFLEEGSSGSSTKMKKPEDIVKELMDQRQQQAAMEDYDKMDEPDSDNIDQDDDDEDEEDEEDGKMQYKIQFQRPNVGGDGGTTSTASTTSGSFLAMVQ
ncbi:trihelix transcription factor GTL1 [Cocos nucifera]|uniref:Trihelix transcription factor GTL1 n=1 Tax=Cocos nucifera TaxID=13894 RepID=A0A8K0ILU8_COCNU|nr:trihelix transcription factor GTL1 [Cocos nucifera]